MQIQGLRVFVQGGNSLDAKSICGVGDFFVGYGPPELAFPDLFNKKEMGW